MAFLDKYVFFQIKSLQMRITSNLFSLTFSINKKVEKCSSSNKMKSLQGPSSGQAGGEEEALPGLSGISTNFQLSEILSEF